MAPLRTARPVLGRDVDRARSWGAPIPLRQTELGYGGQVVDDKVIAEAARTLAQAASSPARVVLFGSRARDEHREDSDLDFLVIEDRVDSKLAEMVALRDALPPLGVPVDVVVVSREEAENRGRRPGTLVHRALAEGRVIVES